MSIRRETGRKNGRSKSWGRKARKGRLTTKPELEPLNFRGLVIFRCEFLSLLPYPIVFLILTSSHYRFNPWSCVEKYRFTLQVARQKHGSNSLATRRACPQAMLNETPKDVVKRRRQRGHIATSAPASEGVTLKVITETSNAVSSNRHDCKNVAWPVWSQNMAFLSSKRN